MLRRVWTQRGTPPSALVHHRYEWLWLSAFVHPHTGTTHWYILPRMTGAAFTVALAEFARTVGAGPDKRIVLVIDQAGWHGGRDVILPVGVHLVLLPPYSPELQPAERLWPLSNEAIANRTFTDLDEVEDVLAKRCVMLMTNPALIKGHTCFHWWPPDPVKPELPLAS